MNFDTAKISSELYELANKQPDEARIGADNLKNASEEVTKKVNEFESVLVGKIKEIYEAYQDKGN